jgi:hypothetical protein
MERREEEKRSNSYKLRVKANGNSSDDDEWKERKKMNERDDDERVQDELPSFSFAELTKLKLS